MTTTNKIAVALAEAKIEVAGLTASIKESEPVLQETRLSHALGAIPFSVINEQVALMNERKAQLCIAEKQVADLTAIIEESKGE